MAPRSKPSIGWRSFHALCSLLLLGSLLVVVFWGLQLSAAVIAALAFAAIATPAVVTGGGLLEITYATLSALLDGLLALVDAVVAIVSGIAAAIASIF